MPASQLSALDVCLLDAFA
ncbi:DUF645 family protein [Vibrio mimicus]|nr:DUF645 family protein [Vibrio cholerae]